MAEKTYTAEESRKIAYNSINQGAPIGEIMESINIESRNGGLFIFTKGLSVNSAQIKRLESLGYSVAEISHDIFEISWGVSE